MMKGRGTSGESNYRFAKAQLGLDEFVILPLDLEGILFQQTFTVSFPDKNVD